MFEELKNEFILNKKMHLFQFVSLILFYVFLSCGNIVAEWIGMFSVNMILMAWMVANAVIITVHTMLVYIKVLFGEIPLGINPGRSMLFKLIGFIFWFSVNTMIFLGSAGTSIPIVAIVLTLLLICVAKKKLISRKMLLPVGAIWFVAFFMTCFTAYPFLMNFLMNVFKNEVIASLCMNIIYFGIAILGYIQMIKQTVVCKSTPQKSPSQSKAYTKPKATPSHTQKKTQAKNKKKK